MRNANLAIAMADKCAAVIQEFHGSQPDLPQPLRPPHLLWMCNQISAHAEHWSIAHTHRWIGFVQAAMMANGMLDLAGLRSMFDEVKSDFGPPDDDPDLVDHLDSESFFEFDIGGQG